MDGAAVTGPDAGCRPPDPRLVASDATTVRAFAEAVVRATTLVGKLTPPAPGLADDGPGPPLRLEAPGRPAELAIRPGPEARTPPLAGMADPAQRVRILHAFANHELQAVELFAWALLVFADAPAAFRAGLLEVLADEQRHTRLYLERLEAHGARFGDQPVSGYFWNKLDHLGTPRDFVCAMCLTFENRNLDHTLDFAEEAERVGDRETAGVLRRVHADEIRHVRFGLEWLGRFVAAEGGQDAGLVDAWEASLRWPLRPELARGPRLHRAPRERAGLDDAFLERLEAAGEAGAPRAEGPATPDGGGAAP